jgi:hypothetical protein
VTVAADETPKLVTKFRKSSNDKNIVSDSRFLTDAELQKFQALLNDAAFWKLPTKEAGPHRYTDSNSCTLEVIKHGNYHAVHREVEPRSRFTDVCEFFTRQVIKDARARSWQSP